MLNLDASIGTMFSFFKLAGDPVGSLLQMRSLARAVPTRAGFEALLEAKAPLVKLFYRGGGRLGGRFGEAGIREEGVGFLERVVPGLGAANRLQFGRIVAAGKIMLFESHLKTLMAIRKVAGKLGIPRIGKWSDEEMVRGAARATMNTFGSTDTVQIGEGAVRQFGERLGLLTPGFMRAFVGLFAKTPSAIFGDPQGIAQFIFLTQFLGVGTTITAAVSYGLTGKWPGPEHWDPRSSEFMTIRSPWGSFSPGGQVRTYARLLANMPKDVMEDNLRRTRLFLLSRESQGLRILHSQTTGRDLFGEPVNVETVSKRQLGPEALSRAIRAAEDIAPISLQSAAEALGEGGLAPETAEAIIVSEMGFNFWPIRIREKLDKVAQAAGAERWRDLSPVQRRERLQANPDLEAEAKADLRDRLRRGDKSAEYILESQRINDKYNEAVAQLSRTSPSDVDFRLRFGDFQRQRSAELTGLDGNPRYADVVDRFRQRDEEALREPVSGPRDANRLVAEYGAVFDRHEGEPDPDVPGGLFEALDAFWGGLKPGEQATLNDNLGLKLPERARAYQRDSRALNNYWGQADLVWAVMQERFPELRQYRDAQSYSQVVQGQLDRRYGLGVYTAAQTRYVSVYDSALAKQRERYRIQNPSADAILVRWHGRKAKTRQAVAIATAASEEETAIAP